MTNFSFEKLYIFLMIVSIDYYIVYEMFYWSNLHIINIYFYPIDNSIKDFLFSI